MDRQTVSSSNIVSVGYDESSGVLEVEFVNGSVYEYFDVPEQLYRDFLNSGSLGAFLNGQIRQRFRYQRI